MRSCLVFTLASVALFGCATQAPKATSKPAGDFVRPIVKSISEPYSESGGAAKYVDENQHLLALRPPVEGEYVKLEPKGKDRSNEFVEFRVPPPKVTVTESVSRQMIVFFRFNSSKLGVDAKSVLKEVAEASPDVVKVTVNGYADSKGKQKSNVSLSKKRSDIVVQALIDAGISEGKIVGDGLGADSPIDDNKSLSGRARNRRVEINIVGEERIVSSGGGQKAAKTTGGR